MKPVDALQQGALTQPQGIAVVDGNRSVSYEQLWQLVNQAANFLKQHHVDRLAFALNNQLAWIVFDLSAQLNHLTLIPIPLFFTEQQKQHAIKESGATFLLEETNQNKHDQLVEVFTLLNVCLYKIDTDIKVIPTGTAKITFTSGSTGTPKGVCLSQKLLDEVSQELANRLQQQSIKRHAVLLPLAILLENIAGIYVPLLIGATIILPVIKSQSSMDEDSLLITLARYHPDSLLLTPQGLYQLLQLAKKTPDIINTLKYVAVGGAKISPSLLIDAMEWGVPVYEGYGLSECGSVVAVNTPTHHKVGSVGKVLSNTHVHFSDEGEILVERNDLLGYTDSVTPPTIIHTGDLGYMEDGYLFVTGRKKNIFINSSGRNFSPEWIEAEAQRYSTIRYLILVGDGKPFNVAIIQPNTQDIGTLEVEIKLLNEELPDYARIKNYVLANEPFSPMNGLLTSNGRPRRAHIYQHYGSIIERFYENEATT